MVCLCQLDGPEYRGHVLGVEISEEAQETLVNAAGCCFGGGGGVTCVPVG